MTNDYIIDAQGKKLGRVASEAAKLLMGKNRSDFERNKIPSVKVRITNASLSDISAKKKASKIYISYSGYPGGLKQRGMKKVITDKGFAEVFKKAVYGMLPANKLRARMMKNLEVSE